MDQKNRKRSIPWLLIIPIALACLLVWKMTNNVAGSGNKNAAKGPSFEIGMMVTPSHEAYACNTLEQSAQVTVFQVMGAKDKLRGPIDRKECARVLPQQRFKIVGLKDKLARITESDSLSTTALWIPARDLAPPAH